MGASWLPPQSVVHLNGSRHVCPSPGHPLLKTAHSSTLCPQYRSGSPEPHPQPVSAHPPKREHQPGHELLPAPSRQPNRRRRIIRLSLRQLSISCSPSTVLPLIPRQPLADTLAWDSHTATLTRDALPMPLSGLPLCKCSTR